jgi:hypothetical protein
MINEDVCFDLNGKPLLTGLKGLFQHASYEIVPEAAPRRQKGSCRPMPQGRTGIAEGKNRVNPA